MRNTSAAVAVPLGPLEHHRLAPPGLTHQKPVSTRADKHTTHQGAHHVRSPLSVTKIQASRVDQHATAVGVGVVGGNITAVNSNRTEQYA